MKVLYDYQVFSFQRFGGVSLYFSELIKNLAPDFKAVIGCKIARSIYLINRSHVYVWDGLESKMVKSSRLLTSLCIRFLRLINGAYFLYLLMRGNFDLVHVTWEVDDWWLPYLKGKPYVCTVHDLIPELFCKNGRFCQRRKRIWQGAARLIAVSENTKRDCIRIAGIPESKIDVVYHAPTGLYGDELGQDRLGSLGDFILFVGGRDGYKNFDWFVKALSPFLRENPHAKLVCTGNPFTKVECGLLETLGIGPQVSCRFVDVADFPVLYRRAKVFVYPSLYEGFGLPILDAFQAGCPVILSRLSCFPEVGGDAALYFDLDTGESLREQIWRCFNDEVYRQSLIVKGRERVRNFSWSKTATETCEVYIQAMRRHVTGR